MAKKKAATQGTVVKTNADFISLKFPLYLTAKPKFQPRNWDRNSKMFANLTLRRVVYRVVQHVQAAIIRKTPGGNSGTRAIWASTAAIKGDWSTMAIYLGPLTQLNAVRLESKRGEWNFGIWFNLEFGREWPHRGGRWEFQENPGKAISPDDPSNAPPGATNADIDMRKWLKSRPRIAQRGSPVLAEPPRTGITRRAQRMADRRAVRARREARQARQGVGMYGFAPIRQGFFDGIDAVPEKEVYRLLNSVLREVYASRKQ